MKILLFRFWLRSKNMFEAHFSIIVVIIPPIFFASKVKCYDVRRAPHSGVLAIMCCRKLWQNFCHHSCIFTAEKRCHR